MVGDDLMVLRDKYKLQTLFIFYFLKSATRIATALRWASSPSRSANCMTVSPKRLRPSAVNCCEVMCLTNVSVLTPEYMRE